MMSIVQFRMVDVVFRVTGMMGEPFQFEADVSIEPSWSKLGQDEYNRLQTLMTRYGEKVRPKTHVVVGKNEAVIHIGIYPHLVITGVSVMCLGDMLRSCREAVAWALKRAMNRDCKFSDNVTMHLVEERDPEQRK